MQRLAAHQIWDVCLQYCSQHGHLCAFIAIFAGNAQLTNSWMWVCSLVLYMVIPGCSPPAIRQDLQDRSCSSHQKWLCVDGDAQLIDSKCLLQCRTQLVISVHSPPQFNCGQFMVFWHILGPMTLPGQFTPLPFAWPFPRTDRHELLVTHGSSNR